MNFETAKNNDGAEEREDLSNGGRTGPSHSCRTAGRICSGATVTEGQQHVVSVHDAVREVPRRMPAGEELPAKVLQMDGVRGARAGALPQRNCHLTG